jgi:hypothetical protein
VPRSNEEEWSVGFAHVTQQADNISDVILPPLLLRLFPFFFFSFFFLVLSWEICDLMAPLAKAMCSTLDFKFTGSFITTIFGFRWLHRVKENLHRSGGFIKSF